MAGVNSDQCVYNTLADAASLGYEVVLVDGASGTTSPEFCHTATLYNVVRCYGSVISASEFASAS